MLFLHRGSLAEPYFLRRTLAFLRRCLVHIEEETLFLVQAVTGRAKLLVPDTGLHTSCADIGSRLRRKGRVMSKIKSGLDFFSLDIDFMRNPKIAALRRRHGNTAVLLYVRLLCDTYAKGYYCKFDIDYQNELKEELGIKSGQMKQVMLFLCERSLVDSTLLTSDTVITSPEIQRRYQRAVKERAKKRPGGVIPVNGRYWLLDEEETEPFIKVTLKKTFPGKPVQFPGKMGCYSSENDLKDKRGNEGINKYSICAAPSGDAACDLTITEFDMRCTEYLINKCRESFAGAWVPDGGKNLFRWQECFAQLRRRYHREEKEIWEVLTWTYQDPFWTSQIRSTKAFLEKYETLYLRYQAAAGVKGGGGKNKFNQFQQNEYDFNKLERELISN